MKHSTYNLCAKLGFGGVICLCLRVCVSMYVCLCVRTYVYGICECVSVCMWGERKREFLFVLFKGRDVFIFCSSIDSFLRDHSIIVDTLYSLCEPQQASRKAFDLWGYDPLFAVSVPPFRGSHM